MLSIIKSFLLLIPALLVCSQFHGVHAFVPTSLSKTTAKSSLRHDHALFLSDKAIVACSILGHVVGGISGAPIVASTTKQDGWYQKIDLPSWTPPNKIFAPVWTFLYACMGLAVSKIYLAHKTQALNLWVIHYVLNLTWAPVFFGMKRLRLGLIINLLLLTTLGVIIPAFHALNKTSALLLVPYFMWLAFATLLNNGICKRNPTKQGYNNAMFQAQLGKVQQDASDYANSW